jgi:hypothetical protein
MHCIFLHVLEFTGCFHRIQIDFLWIMWTLRRTYAELKARVDSLTTLSLDDLLMKVRNLASRPLPDFSRFDAMGLLEAINNSAHDNQHKRANYY